MKPHQERLIATLRTALAMIADDAEVGDPTLEGYVYTRLRCLIMEYRGLIDGHKGDPFCEVCHSWHPSHE